MTFQVWIKQFEGDDTPRGDLAKDIASDSRFPSADTYDEIYAHLKRRGACKDVIGTFKRAWNRYREAGVVVRMY